MRRLIFGVGAIILSLAYFAEPGVAQDVAGTWDLAVEAPDFGGGGGGGRGGGGGGRGGGLFSPGQTLMFTVDGAMIEGTLENAVGSTELSDVTLRGNEIEFTVARQTQRGSFEITYTGEIDGDTIVGTFSIGQGQFTVNWTATRQ